MESLVIDSRLSCLLWQRNQFGAGPAPVYRSSWTHLIDKLLTIPDMVQLLNDMCEGYHWVVGALGHPMVNECAQVVIFAPTGFTWHWYYVNITPPLHVYRVLDNL